MSLYIGENFCLFCHAHYLHITVWFYWEVLIISGTLGTSKQYRTAQLHLSFLNQNNSASCLLFVLLYFAGVDSQDPRSEWEQHSQAVTSDGCSATNKINHHQPEYKCPGSQGRGRIKADHLNTIVRAVKTSPMLSPVIFHNSELNVLPRGTWARTGLVTLSAGPLAGPYCLPKFGTSIPDLLIF